MSVHVLVTCDELSEPARTLSYEKQQSTSLLDLEEECRTDLAERLSGEARKDHAEDSRHFWYNGEFQPHKGRTIGHIARTPTIALNFRRDSYLVSAPRRSGMDVAIDPELTLTEVVEWLQSAKHIGATCCYEVLKSNGDSLIDSKSLAEQNALPYTSQNEKQNSHLRVRTRRPIVRMAIVSLFLCAVCGGAIGWFIHHSLAR